MKSYEKFIKDGGKDFIHKLGFYKSFVSYIKFFILSKVIRQILDNNYCYENIKISLMNDNFINEMLGNAHFRFLPF